MPNYKKLYFELFNQITDTIKNIDNERLKLIEIHRKTEMEYIADENNENYEENAE